MSIHFKPDAKTEARYDREAEQLVKYLTGHDSHGNRDIFYISGNERYADSASIPTMKRLDAMLAKQGEP